MCGIAGFVDLDGTLQDKKEYYIHKMLNSIIHRGPDGEGIYYDKNVTIGHRRLAIIDLTDDGIQPMTYREDYTITFNGEIYNYIELKEELEREGYEFSTKTDTEVLLASYCMWGEDCVKHFNGMWAFCIYDKKKNKLFCSRDRFGIKPFYYQKTNAYFAFSSEIKELLCLYSQRPRADKEKLLSYLICGALDYSEKTMFQDIFQIEAGHNLIFDLERNTLKIEKWYDVGNIEIRDQDFTENIKYFRDAFFDSINLRMRSDVPVGSCLSGGLDSSSIVRAVLKIRDESLEQHTVSSCFKEKAYDEQVYIDEVINSTDIHSHKIFPDMSKVIDEMDKIIWHMDEPFGSTSIYAQWCVFREAKEHHLTVMLDGQGADEQLGGYTSFYNVFFAKLLKNKEIKKFFAEFKKYEQLRCGTEVSPKLTVKFIKAWMNAVMPLRIRNSIKRMYERKYSGPFNARILDNHEIRKIHNLYNEANEKGYFETSMKQNLPTLLHYEDRDSMAFSIEARVPFLDYKVVETCLSIPIEQKIVNGVTKKILRESLKDILPYSIYSRYSKLGFVTPEDKWIRDNSGFIRKELEKAGDILDGFIDKEEILKWFDKHGNEIKQGDFTVWRIICGAHWVKVFNVDINT